MRDGSWFVMQEESYLLGIIFKKISNDLGMCCRHVSSLMEGRQELMTLKMFN